MAFLGARAPATASLSLETRHVNASALVRTTAALAFAAGLSALPQRAHAVAYGDLDCNGGVCGNPNVVMLVGILRSGDFDYGTYGHCSGSLLGRYTGADQQAYYLFLTAGHCTWAWGQGLAGGWLGSVGVSFDPAPAKLPDYVYYRFDPAAFAQGGSPVTQNDYGPVGAWNLVIDYGAVSVPAYSVEAKWPQAAQIAPVILAPDVAFKLDTLVKSFKYPLKDLRFHAVGYGVTEIKDLGSNAGGMDNGEIFDLGVRRVASNQLFTNLRPTLLQTGGNPVLEMDSLCGGDSGGPAFYQNGGQKIQVGITSSGDRNCHSNNFFARLDIAVAVNFLACIRTHADDMLACGFLANKPK